MQCSKYLAIWSQAVELLFVLMMVSGITGCSDPTKGSSSEDRNIVHSEFTANLSGAVNVELTGAGLVTYLGPRERDIVTGNRPGYFVVTNINSDGYGEKELSIIFRIHDQAQPGSHTLKTPDPQKVGKHVDVRLERVEEGELIAYQTNTDGTLNLTSFTLDRTDPTTSSIAGTFQFVTENNQGDKISARGSFTFPVKEKVAYLPGYADQS